jgi:AraC-like DNA-binding protein
VYDGILLRSGPDSFPIPASGSMRYEEFPVDSAIQHLVVNFWVFSTDEHDPEQFEHTIVPDGTSSIGLSRTTSAAAHPMATFVGPRATAAKVLVTANARYCGIRFQPGAGGVALGLNIAELRDRLGPLALVSPPTAQLMVESLGNAASDEEIVVGLERVAIALAEAASPVDSVVARAVEAIIESDGTARIVDVAAMIGIGERQLQRRFRSAVGLTPKEFARMRRVRRACLLALHGADHGLAGLSTDAGFADQAHLTREFGGVFGWSPRLLIAYLERIEHGNIT